MKLSKLFLVALAVVLVPAAAFAQTQITGEVTDNTGGVLPGVTVEAASPLLIEGSRVAVTDGTGRYTIIGLTAGTYTVTMTLPGFSTFVAEGVEVPANFTQTQDGTMSVGGIEETVTVSGESPVVDVQSAARTEVMTRDTIDSLPTPRNTQSIGYLAQGVRLTRPDVGGAQMMEQVRMTAHGANARHTTMQVDGMMVNSQMGDGLIMNYNNQALSQEMAISTSGSPAEVQAGGLRLNMIPKDGGNNLSGTVYVGFTLNNSWQADNFTQKMKDLGLSSNQAVNNIHDINPAIGGPIVRDRLWFFTSVRAISVDEIFPGAFQPTIKPTATQAQVNDYFNRGSTVTCESGLTGCKSDHPAIASVTPAIAEQHVRSALLRLTAQATQRNKVSAYLDRIWKWKKREFSATREPIRASGHRDPGEANYHTAQLKWTSTVSSRALVEVGYSQVYERLLIRNQDNSPINEGGPGLQLRYDAPGDLRTCVNTPCYHDASYDMSRPWFSEAVVADLSTGRQTRNYWGDIWITPSDRFVPSASFAYVTGSHNFKTGIQYSMGNDGDTRNRNGHINVRPYDGFPVAGSAEDRHSIDANNYPVSWNTNVRRDMGIYAQDTWTVDRLTLNVGLRIDRFESLSDTFRTGTSLPGGRFIQARKAPRFEQGPFWTDYSPRISVVYDLFGDARTALKFSMNKFMRPYASGHAERYSPYRERSDRRDWFDCALNPAIHTAGAAGNPTDCASAAQLSGLAASASHYMSTNYDGIVQDHEIGLVNNTAVFQATSLAQSGASPDPNLQREYNWEYSASIQHELAPRISMTVAYYRRVFSDIEQRSNRALQTCNPNTASAGVQCGSWMPFNVTFDDPTGRLAYLSGIGSGVTLYPGQLMAFNQDEATRGLVDDYDVTSDLNHNYYNGLELSMQARLPNGGTIFGGWTAHQTIQDTCGLQSNPNGVNQEDIIRDDEDILRGGMFCDQSALGIPFRNDFKLFGAYPLPGDFEFSGSIQMYSGAERELRWSVPSSYYPGGNRTTGSSIQLFAPGTNFFEYWTQVDIALRKIFRFGGYESSAQMDIYNLMNAATVVDEIDSYGSSFGRPTRLLQGRILRTAFQIKW